MLLPRRYHLYPMHVKREPTLRVALGEMNEQQAREFVEMLAVPEAADPPPCPLCGDIHELETNCGTSSAGFELARSRTIGNR